jgi:hypothetical protein
LTSWTSDDTRENRNDSPRGHFVERLDPSDVANTGWEAMKNGEASGDSRAQEQDAGRGGGCNDRRNHRGNLP